MSSPCAENCRRRIEGNSSATRFGVVHLGSGNMEFECCPAARCASSLANVEIISLAVAAASAGHRKGVKATKGHRRCNRHGQSPAAGANCQRGRSATVIASALQPVSWMATLSGVSVFGSVGRTIQETRSRYQINEAADRAIDPHGAWGSGDRGRSAASPLRRPVRADRCRSQWSCLPTRRVRHHGSPSAQGLPVRSRRYGLCGYRHVLLVRDRDAPAFASS